MSLKTSGSIPTIMYIAALVLIGLMPLIVLSLLKAASAAALSLPLRLSKKLYGTVSKILGRACCTREFGCNKIILCLPRLSSTLSKYP